MPLHILWLQIKEWCKIGHRPSDILLDLTSTGQEGPGRFAVLQRSVNWLLKCALSAHWCNFTKHFPPFCYRRNDNSGVKRSFQGSWVVVSQPKLQNGALKRRRRHACRELRSERIPLAWVKSQVTVELIRRFWVGLNDELP